jgi:hypothetical protein
MERNKYGQISRLGNLFRDVCQSQPWRLDYLLLDRYLIRAVRVTKSQEHTNESGDL